MEKIITKEKYTLKIDDSGILTFIKNGNDFFSVPASASVNGEFSKLNLESADTGLVTYSSDKELMTIELKDDFVAIKYSKTFDEETQIYESRIFTDGKNAIDLKDFDRAFCPQPRNNGGKNMDYYHHLPDISLSGYFTPPIMQFSLGSPNGWVSIGLLDLPDTKLCKMDEDYSFLVESCGGNKIIPSGSEYIMPEILITFPEDEWDAITVFSNKLMEFGKYTPQKPKFSQIPDWWKNPFICTYGDQLIEDRVGQLIDEKWVEEFVDMAENDWGLENINLIIDDSWQLPHAFEPIADEKRFPNFRKFIDRLHKRGHHVILWQTPLLDKITNGFRTRAQKLGVLSEFEFDPFCSGGYFSQFPGCFAIDYTSDNARLFIREIAEKLFGDGDGQYNADGIKLDFMALIRDPAKTQTYAHPERGVGVKELLLFYEMFYEEAKKVKADVIIDSTSGDPRFERFLDFNRMHDTHCGTIEKEIRARIATLGCPDLPIDSDGALMFNSWLRTHYISAALYSVPSNYYLKKYQDEKELSASGKKELGNLFKMVKHRPDGRALMENFGDWILKDGNKVNAITQRGETVVYYPTDKNDTGYIFTWQDEVIILPLYGRKISKITPEPKNGFLLVDYARDVAITRLTPGVVHTFENTDSGDSIDRIFVEKATKAAENVVNYVN